MTIDFTGVQSELVPVDFSESQTNMTGNGEAMGSGRRKLDGKPTKLGIPTKTTATVVSAAPRKRSKNFEAFMVKHRDVQLTSDLSTSREGGMVVGFRRLNHKLKMPDFEAGWLYDRQ